MDADHIAAIDNTTRKLFQSGKKPVTVGMWFSSGHSTIVIGITVGLAVAAKEIVGLVPGFESGGNIWGTGLSGLFLFLIGLLNLFIVRDVIKRLNNARQALLATSTSTKI